jgi:hypothetical protein
MSTMMKMMRLGACVVAILVLLGALGCGGGEEGSGKNANTVSANSRVERGPSPEAAKQRQERAERQRVRQASERREAAMRKQQAERSQEKAVQREEAAQQQRAEGERTSTKPHGSWAGLQYAVEKEGWSSAEAAAFVLQMAEEGLSPKRAQGTAAAALVLEEHGYSHNAAVEGAREAEVALEGVGQ